MGVFLTFFLSGWVQAQIAAIPLTGKQLPAGDLIYKGKVLGQEEALSLGIDLSDLDPQENDLWSDTQKKLTPPHFAIESGDHVRFLSIPKNSIDSGEFLVKVNALDNSIQTLVFDRKLHSTFLRNNLLLKLGYRLPGMKYLKKVTLKFNDKKEKEDFFSRMRKGASSNHKRWVSQEKETEVTFHDIGVIGVQDGQLYDLAAAVPTIQPYNNLRTRVVRAVVLPYSLVDLKESVNKFSWNLGRIAQKKILLPHFFGAHDFTPTTIDDVRWIAKKIAKLSREDFQEIVTLAHFPKSVEKVVLEKILSRRNTLLEILKISHDKFVINSKISQLPHLKKGKILKKDWKDLGYASNFAVGDASSPFKDFHYYILSMIQSAAIDNFLARINKELSVFDPNKARQRLAKKEFIEGLNYFVQTGIFLQFPISSWTSPLASGGLIASRDVVVGNYLGTDNLVQLADTFGYNINLGAITGLENIDQLNQTVINKNLTYVKSFTHLKPLLSVKDVFKENYKNIIVPLLKRNLRKYLGQALLQGEKITKNKKQVKKEEKKLVQLKSKIKEYLKDKITMSNLKNYISRMHKLYSRKKEAPYTLKLLYSLTSKLDQENLELTLDKIEALMIGEEEEHFLRSIIKEISNLLGEGESLIITERFTPNFGASTVIPLGSTSFSAKVSAKVDHTWIKRMQIRRKDSKTIQIFDDRGKGLGFNFSFDIKNRIPILRFNRENKNGQYKVKSYTLNVQANTDLNPHFYKNIAHLNTILSTGSTAALSKEQSPATIRGDFRDTYNRINFLFLKRRRLKGYTEYKLEAFGKLKGDYVSYRDTINTGKDWELFFRDVANYFITKISPDLSLETNLWQNPGQALLGTGKTRTADYEARKTPQGLDLEFIKVGMRYQGWSKKVKGIKKVALKINKSFKQELFSQSHFIQLDKMSLYDIKAHLSIYQSGVDRLKAMTKDQLIKYAFHREYKDLKKCSDYVNLRTLSDGSKIPSCGHMDTALHLLNKCQRLDRLGKKLKRRLKCWTRYASELFNRLDINVLVGILGQDNIYISGEINGFLKNSEHLRKPIRSNTFGRKHPKYPNGPLKVIETKLGINTGELEGYWMRDRL